MCVCACLGTAVALSLCRVCLYREQHGCLCFDVGVWLWLNRFNDADRALSDPAYAWLIVIQVASTLWICAVVVRDIWWPQHDPVRRDGVDDPTGGVCDEATDRPGMPWLAADDTEDDGVATEDVDRDADADAADGSSDAVPSERDVVRGRA